MNRCSISVQRVAFLCNKWRFCATNGVSVQQVAFLCNKWRFCATSGVCVLHTNLHTNSSAGCDLSKATYDPTQHETCRTNHLLIEFSLPSAKLVNVRFRQNLTQTNGFKRVRPAVSAGRVHQSTSRWRHEMKSLFVSTVAVAVAILAASPA